MNKQERSKHPLNLTQKQLTNINPPILHYIQDAHLHPNNAAEIVGKVLPDLSVKVYQATDFGNNIGTLTHSLSPS